MKFDPSKQKLDDYIKELTAEAGKPQTTDKAGKKLSKEAAKKLLDEAAEKLSNVKGAKPIYDNVIEQNLQSKAEQRYAFKDFKSEISLTPGLFVTKSDGKTALIKDYSRAGSNPNLGEIDYIIPLNEKVSSDLAAYLMGSDRAPKITLIDNGKTGNSPLDDSGKNIYLESEFIPGFKDLAASQKTLVSEEHSAEERGKNDVAFIKKNPQMYESLATSIALGNHDFNGGNVGLVDGVKPAIIDLGESGKFHEHSQKYGTNGVLATIAAGCSQNKYNPTDLLMNKEFKEALDKKITQMKEPGFDEALRKSVTEAADFYKAMGAPHDQKVCRQFEANHGLEVGSVTLDNMGEKSSNVMKEQITNLEKLAETLKAVEKEAGKKRGLLQKLTNKLPFEKQPTVEWFVADKNGDYKVQQVKVSELAKAWNEQKNAAMDVSKETQVASKQSQQAPQKTQAWTNVTPTKKKESKPLLTQESNKKEVQRAWNRAAPTNKTALANVPPEVEGKAKEIAKSMSGAWKPAKVNKDSPPQQSQKPQRPEKSSRGF